MGELYLWSREGVVCAYIARWCQYMMTVMRLIFDQYLTKIWPIFEYFNDNCGRVGLEERRGGWYMHTLPTDARSAAGGSWARLENWLCTATFQFYTNVNRNTNVNTNTKRNTRVNTNKYNNSGPAWKMVLHCSGPILQKCTHKYKCKYKYKYKYTSKYKQI